MSGAEEVVPVVGELEDGDHAEGRAQQRQDDAPVDAEEAAAVDLGGIVQLASGWS